tara:strand:+ start:7963 stop:9783 length:1821 start_codon:yes stop_codon:yes gene_type:complete
VIIHNLTIKNFRGIKSGEIRFGDFCVLIGANNSGKTTVIEALALLLGRDRLVRNLTEHDFYGSSPTASDRIQITATVGGFEPNEPDRHPNWFRMGRGIPKWMDLASGAISPVQNSPDDKLVCQIAYCARFDLTSLETEAVRYFVDDETQGDPFAEETNIAILPLNVVKELGFFLVPASRTWDRMMSFGSELFRRTVNYVGGKPAEAVLEERDRLRSPVTPLEEDPRLQSLVSEVNEDIAGLFGRKTELKLRLTSTDSDGVMEAVVPHFAEEDTTPLPTRRHGNGLISLQTLILLMRFGSLRLANGESFLMAIEEPELHIPPPQQRRLLHLMQKRATQTIITTHSPTVAAVPAPHQLTLLVNKSGELGASPLLKEPLGNDASNLQRGLYLTDRDSTVTAIMNPAIMIPEGKTDAGWLRLLARVCDLSAMGTTQVSFTHEVGVIPTKDARISEVFDYLSNVHPQITCLVDGDEAGTNYAKALASDAHPCRRIFQWPTDWAMEDVISWIVAADETVLARDELANANAPKTAIEFRTFLAGKPNKTDDVLHGQVADALIASTACCARAAHILDLLSAIAMDRDPEGKANATNHPNGVTTIWTFDDGFSGI